MIAVVDCGVNNLRSVVRAIEAGGHTAALVTDPDTLRAAPRVLVPGVGHFARVARTLRETGLGDAVRDVAAAGRPVMGICLGMQLLFGASEEAPGEPGLGLLDGTIVRFRTDLPVPHVGWAEVRATDAGRAHPVTAPLLADTPEFYYHVHSFHPEALPAGLALAEGDYGEPFPSIVGRDNLLGAQFHPEKSQRAGLALLQAFAEWTP